MITTLVLAAGLGTRIRAIAGDLPKPLIPFGGQPILIHNLRWLASHGMRTVWINLHYGADRIVATVGNGADLNLQVRFVREHTLLGTAGALANLHDRITGRVLVVYGDNLLRFDLDRLLAVHQARSAAATIALFDRRRHLNTGIAGGRVELAADGRVTGFVEGGAPPAGDQPDLVNAGVYVIEPAVRAAIPPGCVDFGRDIFPAMLCRGQGLYGHVFEPRGFCLGLDTPESYAAGSALLDSGRIALADDLAALPR